MVPPFQKQKCDDSVQRQITKFYGPVQYCLISLLCYKYFVRYFKQETQTFFFIILRKEISLSSISQFILNLFLPFKIKFVLELQKYIQNFYNIEIMLFTLALTSCRKDYLHNITFYWKSCYIIGQDLFFWGYQIHCLGSTAFDQLHWIDIWINWLPVTDNGC